MQKIVILLGMLLAIGGCQDMHQRLGMMKGKKEAGQGGLNTWFESFVDVVDNAEDWDTIAASLDQGKEGGYLDKSVEWEDDQYTPLHYAAEEGNLRVVQELVKDQNIPVDLKVGELERNPLQFAASAAHLNVVKFLVESKADVNYADKQGSNALHYAAAGRDKESIEVITFLVDKGADINSRADLGTKFSVLAFALHAANVDLAKHLMDTYPGIIPEEGSSESNLLLKLSNKLCDKTVAEKLKQVMSTTKH